MLKRSYNTNTYRFAEEIKRVFNVENLELILKHYKSDYKLFPDPVTHGPSEGNLKGTDQGTVYHEKFYNEIDSTDFSGRIFCELTNT